MPDARLRNLGGLDRAVVRFVLHELEAKVMRTDGPESINLDLAFSRFLQEHGVARDDADVIAVDQRDLVRRRLSDQIQRWTTQGVPAPFSFVYESETVIIGWRHSRFVEFGGASWPNDDYADVYDWIGRQSERDFLLPCLCFLKVLGCDPIFVTDGSRDEGVDCIGLTASGGLRSMAVFVQAKSSGEPIGGDSLLQMYAKYAGLPRTRRYMDYLEALGIGSLRDGMAPVYAIMTNNDFKHAAQQGAAKLGVMLRSRRQMAHAICAAYDVRRLEDMRTRIRIPVSADLGWNLASTLSV